MTIRIDPGGDMPSESSIAATQRPARPTASKRVFEDVFDPFVGLVVLVAAAQLGEVVRAVAPAAGDWALEGVAALTIVALALRNWREQRSERLGPREPALVFALLYTLALLLSALFADNSVLAASGVRKGINLFVLFYLIVRMTNSLGRLQWLIGSILVSTAVSAGLAVAGFLRGSPLVGANDPISALRQAGGAADPAMSSHAMLAGTALAAVLAARSKSWRALSLVTLAVGTSGIFLSETRTTAILYVALALGLLVKLRRSAALPVAIALALLFAVASVSVLPETWWHRVSALKDPSQDWTLERRVGYHVIAADLFARHPILGVGPNNFVFEYVDPRYRYVPGRTLEPRALHDMYLAVLIESGLIGFAAFAALIVCAWAGVRAARHDQAEPDVGPLAEALQFALVGYLVACATAPSHTAKYTWILLALAVACGRLSEARSGAAERVYAGTMARRRRSIAPA